MTLINIKKIVSQLVSLVQIRVCGLSVYLAYETYRKCAGKSFYQEMKKIDKKAAMMTAMYQIE